MPRAENQEESRATGGRFATIVTTVAIAVAVTGFLSGASQRDLHCPGPPRERPEVLSAPPAPAYGDARGPRAIGVNGGYVSRLETLRAPEAASATPARGEETPPRPLRLKAPSSVPASPEERAAAMRARAARRAYDGAPPVIPHPAAPRQVELCLACHGEGLVVGSAVAPRMSHPRYLSCTQCHVESSGGSYATASLAAFPADAMSAFAGIDRPGPGPRASPIAPPVMPHTTRMREDCLSCHGPLAPAGLRTSHPGRASCLQCHATQAPLDQRVPPPLEREAPARGEETPPRPLELKAPRAEASPP